MALNNVSTTDFVLTLKDFLEGFPPPQNGRIIGGLPLDIQEQSGIDIGNGTKLKFHRKVNPNVPVSFRDPWGKEDDHFIKVTLPVDFPGKFTILAYDPESGDTSNDHIFHTVNDLIKSFPVLVQSNASYGNRSDEQSSSFECGDRLKLIRLVYKDCVKYLECRKEGETRLLTLPMSCVGEFTAVPIQNEYLLADLISLLPRKRRVRLCSELNSKNTKIPGLPSDFYGDVFIDELEYFVEASPLQEEGLIIGLPHDLEMTVAPEDFERGLLLNSFATNNRNLFPVVACVTDWDEETTILENHFIKPGVELCIHGWTRHSKILAKSDGKYFAIPLTYQGRFTIKPQEFDGVSELEYAHPGYKLRVVSVDQSVHNFPLAANDVIRITHGDSIKKAKSGEVKYLKVEKYSTTGTAKMKTVKLPISTLVKFEEILEDTKVHEFHIRELVSFVSDQAVNVVLKRSTPDQKIHERDLPLDKTITLCEYVVEPAIYVSVDLPDAPAFHIPLRTLLYVQFVEQLDKSSSPLLTKINPKLSTLDRCIEIIPFEIFQQLVKTAEENQTFQNGLPPHQSWTGGRTWQGEGRKNSIAEPDIAGVSTLPLQRQPQLADRRFRSTENIHRAAYGQEPSLTIATRVGSEQDLSRANVSASPKGPSSPNEDPTVARAFSPGKEATVNGPPLQTHDNAQYHIRREGGLGPSKLNQNGVNGVPAPDSTLSGSTLPSSPTQTSPPHSPTSPDVQVPPGYVLMPTAQAQAIPPGFTLVPVMQPQWGGGSVLGSKAGSTMGSIQRLNSPSMMGDDSDGDDAASEISRFSFSKAAFKVTIPPDGNLYHFSNKKFCELLRLLKIEEPYIRACLRDKIDGKKFSRMNELHMERYGLLHPIMIYFRRITDKKKASGKFSL